MKPSVIKALNKKVKGKNVLVTGASSGIGLTVAKMLGAAGAHVLLVSRTRATLEEVKAEIEAGGGKASVFPCDLNDMASIEACAQEILADVGHIDVLVNNAGRSIRRAVHESLDRFHDFERTMQLNYFGAALLGLCGLQGRAGCLQPLPVGRSARPQDRPDLDLHAAGAHPDDCTDQDVQLHSDPVA